MSDFTQSDDEGFEDIPDFINSDDEIDYILNKPLADTIRANNTGLITINII
jgi:hypothetical protein